MHDTIKNYLKEHWVSMAISLGTSGIVFIISLITIFTNFRVDYAALKEQVSAGSVSNQATLEAEQQLILQTTKINQKLLDNDNQINQIDANIADIHRYLFGFGKQ